MDEAEYELTPMLRRAVSLDRVFAEAHRRWLKFGFPRGKSLLDAWVGLGIPSVYAEATHRKLMVPVGVNPPWPRVLAWYKFTDAGVAAYEVWRLKNVAKETAAARRAEAQEDAAARSNQARAHGPIALR